MAKMRAAQVPAGKGPFQIVERDIPEPGPGLGSRPGAGLRHLPQRLPHEGGDLARPPVPARAGARDRRRRRRARRRSRGLQGRRASRRRLARRTLRPLRVLPPRGLRDLPGPAQIPGITFDGGHADYVVAPAVALARIPEGLSAADAAPLMCAGITTFNSLRNAGAPLGGPRRRARHRRARPSRRPVRGPDGLRDRRHRPRQRTRSRWRASSARSTTSTATAQDPAAELSALGGARVILATVTSGKAMTAALGGLAIDGTFVVLGAPTSRSRSRRCC